jgi:hypothetical protein
MVTKSRVPEEGPDPVLNAGVPVAQNHHEEGFDEQYREMHGDTVALIRFDRGQFRVGLQWR